MWLRLCPFRPLCSTHNPCRIGTGVSLFSEGPRWDPRGGIGGWERLFAILRRSRWNRLKRSNSQRFLCWKWRRRQWKNCGCRDLSGPCFRGDSISRFYYFLRKLVPFPPIGRAIGNGKTCRMILLERPSSAPNHSIGIPWLGLPGTPSKECESHRNQKARLLLAS